MERENIFAKNAELRAESNRLGINFLKTDLDAALTFAQAALQARDDTERRIRNQFNARRGYDAIARLSTRFTASAEDIEEFQQRFGELRAVLERLGEKF